MTRVAVIDFETTGMSPLQGDRATEIGVVLMEGEQVVDRWHSLMNAGLRIPYFIESLTGISTAMVQAAPPAAQVMAEAARFVGDAPMAAHNAAFDRRFWQAELALAGLESAQPFACTLLLSRRLYPQAVSHRLGALAQWHALPASGPAHRALADAETAAALLARIRHDLRRQHGVADVRHGLLMQLQASPRHRLQSVIERHLA